MTISYTHSLHKMYPIQLTIKPCYQQVIFLELNPTVDSFFPFISECVIRDLLGFSRPRQLRAPLSPFYSLISVAINEVFAAQVVPFPTGRWRSTVTAVTAVSG